MAKTYTADTVHGPEVDFGVWWRAKDTSCHYRLTWEAYADPKTGYSDRGDVVAVSGTGTRRLVGRDIPLFVVEHFLSLPYNSVGIAGYDPDETGWVVAMYNNTLDWVEHRLARWNGCDVVSYSGKERYQGEVKAARQYGWRWDFEARSGGWIYTRSGKAFTQGWRSFAADLKASRVIAPVVQETTGTDYRDRRYSETWVVSVTKSTFGAYMASKVQQIRCSRKAYTCDTCEQEIPAGSSYRMRQFLDLSLGGTVKEQQSLRRWHDDCPLPAPLCDWAEQEALRAARRAASAQRNQERYDTWKERTAPLRRRLEALGVQHPEPPYETPVTGPRYALVAPSYFKLNIEAVELLLGLIGENEQPTSETGLTTTTKRETL